MVEEGVVMLVGLLKLRQEVVVVEQVEEEE